jgi:hypothetical protein
MVWEKMYTAPTRAAKTGQNLLYRHDKTNEPTKEGPLPVVLFESPFTLVSAVSRGYQPRVSLSETELYQRRREKIQKCCHRCSAVLEPERKVEWKWSR